MVAWCGRHGIPRRLRAITKLHTHRQLAIARSVYTEPRRSTKFQVRNFVGDTFSFNINQPGDLDFWPFDLEADARVGLATFLPILVFLGLFVLDLAYRPTTIRRTM